MEDIITVERIAVIANGEVKDYDQLAPSIKGYDQYIAINGGLSHCVALGLTPLLLIGDMDSVDSEAKKKFPHTKELRFSRDKDETDLDLTLRFLMRKHPKSITIFAGFGKRVDFSLANLISLTRYPGKVFLETENEVLGVVDQTLDLSTHKGQTLSLIPINGLVTGVTTDGLKWNLKEERLEKTAMGVSNEAMGKSICITVKTGDLLFSLHKN